MATNSMVSQTSDMMFMQTHDISFNDASTCISSVNECHDSSSEHSHQNCIDSHCSSFSGLLIDYNTDAQNISSLQTVLRSVNYISIHSSSPYFPPIVIS
jgi:hypothetical protein